VRVLVTGSASRLAAVLLPRLAADERVKQIIGVDRRETTFRDPRYTQVLLDTRSAELAAVCAKLGRMPSVEEYLAVVKDKIAPLSENIYRYLNFHQMEQYIRPGKVIPVAQV